MLILPGLACACPGCFFMAFFCFGNFFVRVFLSTWRARFRCAVYVVRVAYWLSGSVSFCRYIIYLFIMNGNEIYIIIFNVK